MNLYQSLNSKRNLTSQMAKNLQSQLAIHNMSPN